MHLFTHSPLLRALGWSLFNSLWQMAILWLVYALFQRLFKQASAGARHGIALILLTTGALWTIISLVNNYFSGTDSGDLVFLASGSPQQYLYTLIEGWLYLALPYFTSLYLASLGFLSTRYFIRYFQSRKLRTNGLVKADAQTRLYVAETGRSLGIKKQVRIWLSTLVDCPMTLGFLKPVILIPVAVAGNLSIQQVETILLHELAHIKRNDYILNLVLTTLEIFYFFNPFTRKLIGEIKKEREHRCDDLVMQFRYEPQTYISALLSLARMGTGQHLALAATGSTNDKDQFLLHRVKRMLAQPQNNVRPGIRSIAFLALVLSTMIFVLARNNNNAGVNNTLSANPKEGNAASPLVISGLQHQNITASPRANDGYYTVNLVMEESSSLPGSLAFSSSSITMTFDRSEMIQPPTINSSTPTNETQMALTGRTIGTEVNARIPANVQIRVNAPIPGNAQNIAVTSPTRKEQLRSQAASAEKSAWKATLASTEIMADQDEADDADQSNGQNGAIEAMAPQTTRNYSLSINPAPPTPALAPYPEAYIQGAAAPYVPGSNFVIHYRTDTSTLPGIRRLYAEQAMAQKMAVDQINKAVLQLQMQLKEQLRTLDIATKTAAGNHLSNAQLAALKTQKDCILQQLRLQEEYLQQQKNLQKKMQQLPGHKVIVEI